MQRDATTSNIKEFKLHVYGKQQTSDSSWEFLKIENEQIKTGGNAKRRRGSIFLLSTEYQRKSLLARNCWCQMPLQIYITSSWGLPTRKSLTVRSSPQLSKQEKSHLKNCKTLLSNNGAKLMINSIQIITWSDKFFLNHYTFRTILGIKRERRSKSALISRA